MTEYYWCKKEIQGNTWLWVKAVNNKDSVADKRREIANKHEHPIDYTVALEFDDDSGNFKPAYSGMEVMQMLMGYISAQDVDSWDWKEDAI